MKPNDAEMPAPRQPRILLAEDDPVSARFLAAALTKPGCTVHTDSTGIAALQTATRECFDLLVIDNGLPGLGAETLLRRLHANASAASRATPAVATSAEWDQARRKRLYAAGFAGLLAKPCDEATLQALLQEHVAAHAWPARHDALALASAGNASNLAGLRKLFATELDKWTRELPTLVDHREELVQRLHRLCSSAGLCGAPALAAACRHWLRDLRAAADCDAPRKAFEQALQDARREFS